MPRASSSGYSNGADDSRVVYGYPVDEQEEESSAGTNSLTSGSKPDKSGTSTGTGRQSPAPTTGNRSYKDPHSSLVSSTAPTTGGSGQETSSDPQSPQDSSADSAQEDQATQGQNSPKGQRARKTRQAGDS